MRYLWTEDKGAGLHFWELINEYMFAGELVVESKESNQQLLDAVRDLVPAKEDTYFIAFDMVYDNMDVMNKLLELQEIVKAYPKQIKLLDVTCFEYFILAFEHLIEWTGSGRKDKIAIRTHILDALQNHKIDIDGIDDQKTLNYLMGFKRYSTERVLKSITYELTDGDAWSVKGNQMGDCWWKDCCVLEKPEKSACGVEQLLGKDKIATLFHDTSINEVLLAMKNS